MGGRGECAGVQVLCVEGPVQLMSRECSALWRPSQPIFHTISPYSLSPRLMTDPMTPMQVLQDLTNQELQADEEEKEAAAADAAGRR